MNMLSPQARLVLHNAIAFDTADNVFNAHTYAGYCTILFLFVIRECAVFWFLFGLFDDYVSDATSLKAHILIDDAAFGEAIVHVIGQSFIIPCSFIRGTEKINAIIVLNDQNMLNDVTFSLSTVVQLLLIIVQWPMYWSLTTVMDKRGLRVQQS